MEENKIKFTTLHDGVGFHPFSDGLPYAPQTKTSPQQTKPALTTMNGMGAVSAGRPTFSTARQLQQQSMESLISQSIQPKVTPKTFTAESVSETEGPGLLRRRIFAFLMDTTIHLAFWTMMNLVAIFAFSMEFDSAIIAQNWESFLTFFMASQTLFIGMQNLLFDNSMGKYFFGLEFKHKSRKLQIRRT